MKDINRAELGYCKEDEKIIVYDMWYCNNERVLTDTEVSVPRIDI